MADGVRLPAPAPTLSPLSPSVPSGRNCQTSAAVTAMLTAEVPTAIRRNRRAIRWSWGDRPWLVTPYGSAPWVYGFPAGAPAGGVSRYEVPSEGGPNAGGVGAPVPGAASGTGGEADTGVPEPGGPNPGAADEPVAAVPGAADGAVVGGPPGAAPPWVVPPWTGRPWIGTPSTTLASIRSKVSGSGRAAGSLTSSAVSTG